MKVTLKHIIQELSLFADRHYYLNGFFSGNVNEVPASQAYPLLLVRNERMRLANGEVQFGLNILVVDKKLEESDPDRILADTAMVIEDIRTIYSENPDWGFNISDVNECQVVDDKLSADVLGWFTTVFFATTSSQNEPQVPLSPAQADELRTVIKPLEEYTAQELLDNLSSVQLDGIQLYQSLESYTFEQLQLGLTSQQILSLQIFEKATEAEATEGLLHAAEYLTPLTGKILASDNQIDHIPAVTLPAWISNLYAEGKAKLRSAIDAIVTEIELVKLNYIPLTTDDYVYQETGGYYLKTKDGGGMYFEDYGGGGIEFETIRDIEFGHYYDPLDANSDDLDGVKLAGYIAATGGGWFNRVNLKVKHSGVFINDTNEVKKGAQYEFSDFSGLVENSLVPKKYVDDKTTLISQAAIDITAATDVNISTSAGDLYCDIIGDADIFASNISLNATNGIEFYSDSYLEMYIDTYFDLYVSGNFEFWVNGKVAYGEDKVITDDLEIVHKKYVDNKVASAAPSEPRVTTESISGEVIVDLANKDVIHLTLTGNVTSFDVTNAVPGKTYKIYMIQDGTGNRTITGFAAKFKTENDVPILLSTDANTYDMLQLEIIATDKITIFPIYQVW